MEINIPAGALIEGHGDPVQTDDHLTIVDQAEGIEYDLWQVRISPIPANGGDLTISWGYTRAICNADGPRGIMHRMNA